MAIGLPSYLGLKRTRFKRCTLGWSKWEVLDFAKKLKLRNVGLDPHKDITIATMSDNELTIIFSERQQNN
jgi:hypothetical protein